MNYSIDLNPRQSSRTLEQAIRHQALVMVEPRVWPEGEPILCRFGSPDAGVGDNQPRLTLIPVPPDPPKEGEDTPPTVPFLVPAEVPAENWAELLGTYCDACIILGEQRYIFSADVVGVERTSSPEEPARLHVSRPITIQVIQRRRFRRIELFHSTQVELTWTRENDQRMGGVAWLCNLSGEGLACRTEERVADLLWIGDRVHMDFALTPGDPERFALEGTLCNKTPTGNSGKIVLGIQFLTGDAYPASTQAAYQLRRRLAERYTHPANSRKGVDS